MSPAAKAAPLDEDEIPLDDPVVTAHIHRAVAPYRAVLPADAQDELEELLWMVLTTHPHVAPLVHRLRRDAATQRSGTRATPRRGRGDR